MIVRFKSNNKKPTRKLKNMQKLSKFQNQLSQEKIVQKWEFTYF